MHESVKGRLEDYLSGASVPDVEDHLRACEGCRKEAEAMREQSALFRTLKAPPPADAGPGPAFYAMVMQRIETQARPSVWNLFGDSLFAKRLAYASAVLLVLFSSFLMSLDPAQDEVAGAPEAILAGYTLPQPVSMDKQRDRDVVLVNLATWGDSGADDSDEQGYQ